MISGREFVTLLPSSFRRIYWQYCSGSCRDPSLPMTTMQSPGGRKLNDDTSAPQEWHMGNAWWWWWWWWRITTKWVQRTISFDVLVEVWLHACLPWPYKDVRVQIHTPGERGPGSHWKGGRVGPRKRSGSQQNSQILPRIGAQKTKTTYPAITASQLSTDHNLTHNICVVNLRYRHTSIPELRHLIFCLEIPASLEFPTSCTHPMYTSKQSEF